MLRHCCMIIMINFILLASSNEAIITGDRYLGISGNSANIIYKNKECTLGSYGSVEEKSFTIEFRCDNKTQILWNMSQLLIDKSSFDEPTFTLIWAGDKDNDGKIDIIVDMSPKYSYSKKTTYLSSKAVKGKLLGISGNPKITYGC